MEGLGVALQGLMSAVFILLALAPFGIWKIVEIVIWLFSNVNITVD